MSATLSSLTTPAFRTICGEMIARTRWFVGGVAGGGLSSYQTAVVRLRNWGRESSAAMSDQASACQTAAWLVASIY